MLTKRSGACSRFRPFAALTALVVPLVIIMLASANVSAAMFRAEPDNHLSNVREPERSPNEPIAHDETPTRTDQYGDPLPDDAVARLGSLRLYHGEGDVSRVVLSPNGKLVVSTSRNGSSKLWDVATGRELPLQKDLPRAFFFAAGGKLLARDAGVGGRFWDVATGKVLPEVTNELEAAWEEAASGREIRSPEGKTLVEFDQATQRIRLLDAASRKELPPLENQSELAFFSGAAFSLDGKLLAVPNVKNLPGVHLWDLTTRKQVWWLKGKGPQIYGTSFSADGKLLAGADGSGVTIWDLKTGKWLHDFGHNYVIGSLAFTPDQKTLLTGASYNDPIIRLWDPLTGRLRDRWSLHDLGVVGLAVTPDGKRAISASQDSTIRLWDLATGKEIGRIGDNKQIAWALAISPDGKLLATGGRNIRLWDLATGRELRSFGSGTLLRLAFSPDGKMLASTTSRSKVVSLWNVATGTELRHFASSARNAVLALSPDGRLLATGAEDATIRMWDVATGHELHPLGERVKPSPLAAFILGAITFSPDGRVVAAAYADTTVRLLEVSTGKERALFQGHRAAVVSIAFSADGLLLASGCWDRIAMVWDVLGRAGISGPGRVQLEPKRLNELWADLGAADAAKAYEAMKVLVGATQTVALLKERLSPAVPIDQGRLTKLVTDLDSKEFAVREKATADLPLLGEAAESSLLEVLAGKPSAEVKRRIQAVLTQIEPLKSEQTLRALRTVEVLEYVGTPEARLVLESLAKGASESRLTRQARASMARLAKKASANP